MAEHAPFSDFERRLRSLAVRFEDKMLKGSRHSGVPPRGSCYLQAWGYRVTTGSGVARVTTVKRSTLVLFASTLLHTLLKGD